MGEANASGSQPCGCPKTRCDWSGGFPALGTIGPQDASASCLVSAHDRILGTHRVDSSRTALLTCRYGDQGSGGANAWQREREMLTLLMQSHYARRDFSRAMALQTIAKRGSVPTALLAQPARLSSGIVRPAIISAKSRCMLTRSARSWCLLRRSRRAQSSYIAMARSRLPRAASISPAVASASSHSDGSGSTRAASSGLPSIARAKATLLRTASFRMPRLIPAHPTRVAS